MLECKPIATPVELNQKMRADEGDPLPDPLMYRSLVGGLQYLTFTRPDIAFIVNQVCQYMHSIRKTHLEAAKRIMRYGTKKVILLIIRWR